MLILKTDYGDFGNLKDMYRFMIEENLDQITVTGEYIGVMFCNTKLNLATVKRLSLM